jgi:uncharacterized protein
MTTPGREKFMPESRLEQVAQELGLKPQQIQAVAALLDDGATVPFIARYRKEATGSMDEVAIMAVRDRLHQLKELDERRAAILKSLTERELLTPELEEQINAAETMSVLEDLYLPFRPKRRTKGMMAKEKGLEPLALAIWQQDGSQDPAAEAAEYIDPEKGVEDADSALSGARDIMAEWINEDAQARAKMRKFYLDKAQFVCKVITGQEEPGAKFKDYFDWSEPAAATPSHRVLAMRRGEKEGFLLLRVQPPAEDALALLEGLFLQNDSPAAEQVRLAAADSYKRLLGPAMETELRLITKQKADEEAVKVFAANLRELLLAAPLGQKRVLAIDPGFRTGCKLVCLDAQGRMLHYDTINILGGKAQAAAAETINKMVQEYAVEAIAIGNGTASRETEALVRGLELPRAITVVMVSEAGASVYSASEVARTEFPDLDVSVRGAVSIGRRLMDPLAELVKIDPKSIGVGQYQHDVEQGDLKRSLEDVVISCVNAVGVEVNTASPQLLAHVSGLGPSLAANVVTHREANGPFESRQELLKVPRLGPKAFEQAAGFLRIQGGENPLDASAVHPESYPIVESMAQDLGCAVADLLRNVDLRKKIDPQRYVGGEVGLPTINDIMAELEKPGRDPRERFEEFSFAEGVHEMSDLQPGMRLPGIVTNVTNFGAFVDVGVHQDGLVHISQMADRFVKDPYQVVKVHDKVMVSVLEVDLNRGRISLSMRTNPQEARRGGQDQPRKQGGPSKGGKGGRGGKPKGKPAPPPQNKSKAFNNPFAEALSGLKKD